MERIIEIFESVRRNKESGRIDLFTKENPYYYILEKMLKEAEVIYGSLSENEQKEIKGKLNYIKTQYDKI